MTELNRRDFLRNAMMGTAALAWPEWMPRMSFSPSGEEQRGDVLVVIFLRGAADVLNIIVPHGDEGYYAARPTINIPRPDDNKIEKAFRSIDLDGFFGLHPALASLQDMWQDQNLGIIHAVGAPDESRSHFKAMELMERGVSDETGPASGWIGRHLASHDTGNPSPLRAIGLGENVPRSLYGSVPVTAMRSIIDFHLWGDTRAAQQMKKSLRALYAGEDTLSRVGKETLDILDTVSDLDPESYRPDSERVYPESDFGRGLSQIAMLVKAQVGLEVATVDVGGWDTHFGQGGVEGLMANLLRNLGEGLSAFYADLHQYHDKLNVVVMSEFGRRVQENASLGTDHGHGSAMFLIGSNVVGGKVHGNWPGLSQYQLFGPGDLAATIDYRDVLSELLEKRMNNKMFDQIFPDHKVQSHGFLY